MKILKLLLIVTVLACVLMSGFIIGTSYILKNIQSVLIKGAEKALNKKIEVGHFSRTSDGGIDLKDIYIYNALKPKENGVFLEKIHIHPFLGQLIRRKQLLLPLEVESARYGNVTVSGMLTLESGTFKSYSKIAADFSITKIDILGMNVKTDTWAVSGIKGPVFINYNEVNAPTIEFYVADKMNSLSLIVNGLKGSPISTLSIRGPDISADIKAVYSGMKITFDVLKVKLLNSSLDARGAISLEKNDNPFLSFDGTADIKPKDLCFLNAGFTNACEYLRLDGVLTNKFSLSGNFSDVLSIKLNMKSSSSRLNVWDYKFENLNFSTNLENGVLSVPLFKADFYKGIFIAAYAGDISKRSMPFNFNMKIQNVDVNGLAQDSDLKNKELQGKLFSELSMDGAAIDQMTYTGSGNIHIMDANLGPMPLLAPLIGSMYGPLSKAIPGATETVISGGSCSFTIAQRKVVTNDLKLWGDVVDIYAKGFIDFDKNLNFEVENQFKERTSSGQAVQEGLAKFVASVGKFLGKAYLTGSLSKPKWKFDYFNNMEDSLGGKINNAIRNILQ